MTCLHALCLCPTKTPLKLFPVYALLGLHFLTKVTHVLDADLDPGASSTCIV